MQWHCRLPSFVVLFALTMGSAYAATYPEPVGHVNDFASVMSAQTQDQLESLLKSLRTTTGVEMAVVTLPSLKEEPIENTANALFQQWGIGQKGKDNGLLFLIAPNDRKIRFEVGYGLEPILTDALTGRILDDYVVPEFRKGDLNAGILKGTQAAAQIIAKKYDATLDTGSLPLLATPQEVREESSLMDSALQLLLIIVVVILFIRYPRLFFFLWMFGGRGGRGGGFGSGSSGGFGGFGGGSSGGGGSSRSW